MNKKTKPPTVAPVNGQTLNKRFLCGTNYNSLLLERLTKWGSLKLAEGNRNGIE
jgi:hypothetical protein